MNTISDVTKFETIRPQGVKENSEGLEATLDSLTQEYYRGLAEAAFRANAEPPVTTGEVQEDYTLGSEVLNSRIAEDRLSLIEGLATKGLIDPRTSVGFYNEKFPDPSVSLETLQADNIIKDAGVEDYNAANDILDNPDKTAKNTRYLTNLGIVNSVIQDVIAQEEGSLGYFLSGFLPFVDVYRASTTEADTLGSNIFDYAVNLHLEFNRRMDRMEPEDFEKWLKGFVIDQRNKGQSWNRIEDLLIKAYNPNDEVPLSIIGDVADVTGVVGAVTKGGSAAVKVAKATGESVKKAAAKGVAKGAFKGAIQSVPLAPTAANLVTGTLKKAERGIKLATDKVGAKLLAGNLQGASAKVVDDIKKAVIKGAAGIEKADEARELVYKFVVEPYAKASVYPTVQPGRIPSIQGGILETGKYYQVASKEAERLGGGTLVPKWIDQSIQTAVDSRSWIFDPSSNLAQVTDIPPVNLIGNNSVSVRTVIGNGAGQAFTTQKQAEAALKRFMKSADKEAVSAEVIQTSPRSYYIQADTKLANNIGEIFSLSSREGGRWKPSYLLGTKGTMPQRIEDLREAAVRDSNYMKSITDRYRTAVKALNKEERAMFEALKEIEQAGEWWFTPEYLRSSGVSDRVVNAYMSSRMLEDLNWVAKGFYTSKRLSEEGFVRIAYHPEQPIITGRIIAPEKANFDSHWIKFTDDDPEVAARKLTLDEFKKDYKDYKIIEGIYSVDDIPANKVYLLAPSDNVLVRPLDKFFGNYVPGFRHFYDPSTYFIKQPQLVTLPNGRVSLSDVHTIRGATTLKDAQDYADELNKIREVMNSYLEIPMKSTKWDDARRAANIKLQDMNNRFLNFNNVDDALMFAEKEGVDFLHKDAVVGVLREGDDTGIFRSTLSMLDESDKGDFVKFMKQYNWSSPSAIARLERGEGIKDVLTDTHLPWLDINGELNKTVREIERYGSMDDYTRVFAADWANTFKGIVDDSVEPVTALSRGMINKTGDRFKIQQAVYAKKMHDFIRGVPNTLDRACENWLGSILLDLGKDHEWLKRIPGLGGAFEEGSRTFNFINKLTPLDTLKTWTAHWNLGMMRPKQLITQALAVLQTLAISPRAAAKALPYSFITPSLLAKADDAAFDLAVKMVKADGVTDITKSNIKQLVENLKRFNIYGQALQGGALAGMDTKASKLSEASFYFFKKGEAFNRVHSATTALMEKGLEFSDISKLKPSEIAELLTRAEELYMNMGKAGISIAQMGRLSSVLLQMKGFQLRGLEAIVGGTLTAAERGRLLLFHVLGTGVKGTIGGSIGYNFYGWMTDSGVPDEVALPVYEGLLNTLSREIMDHPVDFSGYLSPEYLGILEDMYDVATKGPIQFIAGSTVAGKTWNSLSTTANVLSSWAWGEGSTETTKNLFKILYAQKSLPTSVMEASTAYHIFTAGNKLSTTGALIGSDLDMMDGVYALFGMKTIDEVDYSEFVRKLSDDKEKVNNATKDLLPIFMLAARDPNGFNLDLFENVSKTVRDNYGLNLQQYADVWNNINKRASENLVDYKARLSAGIIKHKGTAKAKEELEARRIW